MCRPACLARPSIAMSRKSNVFFSHKRIETKTRCQKTSTATTTTTTKPSYTHLACVCAFVYLLKQRYGKQNGNRIAIRNRKHNTTASRNAKLSVWACVRWSSSYTKYCLFVSQFPYPVCFVISVFVQRRKLFEKKRRRRNTQQKVLPCGAVLNSNLNSIPNTASPDNNTQHQLWSLNSWAEAHSWCGERVGRIETIAYKSGWWIHIFTLRSTVDTQLAWILTTATPSIALNSRKPFIVISWDLAFECKASATKRTKNQQNNQRKKNRLKSKKAKKERNKK